MIQRHATIQNAAGIHCRPSATIIKAVHNYPGDIALVTADGEEIDLRSMLALVALGLEEGATVTVRVMGPDEEAFCGELVELLERHFDFPALGTDERSRAARDMLVDI